MLTEYLDVAPATDKDDGQYGTTNTVHDSHGSLPTDSFLALTVKRLFLNSDLSPLMKTESDERNSR